MHQIAATYVWVMPIALRLLNGHIARMRTEKRVRLLTLLDLLILHIDKQIINKLLTRENEPKVFVDTFRLN